MKNALQSLKTLFKHILIKKLMKLKYKKIVMKIYKNFYQPNQTQLNMQYQNKNQQQNNYMKLVE